MKPVGVLDNQLLVTTPENIAFHYQVAGPFQRVLAFLLDIAISQIAYWSFAAAIMLLFSVVLAPTTAASPAMRDLVSTAMGILSGLVLVGAFVVTWFYGAVTEAYFNGQTFGKMLTHLRVLSTDGSAINGTQAALRNFFRLLDAWPPISLGLLLGIEMLNAIYIPTFLLGLVLMAVNRKYQRTGDLIAGTMVVCEEKKWTHGLAQFQDPRVPQLAELIPVDFEVSPNMARALADFSDQRRYLSQPRVAEIASHLGIPLNERFGFPKDTCHDLLLCSLYYKTFISEQAEQSAREHEPERTPNLPKDEPQNLQSADASTIPPGGTVT